MHALTPMPTRRKHHAPRQRMAEPARADLFGTSRQQPARHQGGWPRYLDGAGRGGAGARERGGCTCGGTCPACTEAAGPASLQLSGSDHAVAEAAGAPGPAEEHDIASGRDGGQAPAPAQTAPPVAGWPAPVTSITATTTAGPTWGQCRAFLWDVDWSTAGRNGFIVQEINNGGRITNCADGTAVPAPFTPRYWEAWAVDANGNVGDGGADRWSRAQFNNTSGMWTMSGRAHFVAALDPAAGFSRTAVPDANGLLATTTQPSGLPAISLSRVAMGVWNCCGTKREHDGFAL
jgi:hypothetical protein